MFPSDMTPHLNLGELYKLEEELIGALQDLEVKDSHIHVIEGLFEQMREDHRLKLEGMKEGLF